MMELRGGDNTRIDINEAGTTFPLLELPGEQRNQIYRYLFDDIIIADKEIHVWKDREGLPRHPGLMAYCALTLTTRQVNMEASTIFEKEYLPRMTFYFDKLSTLCPLSYPAPSNKFVQSGAKFLFRSPYTSDSTSAVDSMPPFLGLNLSFRDVFPVIGDECGAIPFDPPDVYAGLWYDDSEVLGYWREHDGVMYASHKLRMQPPALRGMAFSRYTMASPARGDSIWAAAIEGRFCDVDWATCVGKTAAGAPDHKSELNRVFDRRELPAMNILWCAPEKHVAGHVNVLILDAEGKINPEALRVLYEDE